MTYTDRRYSVGALVVDPEKREISRGGEVLEVANLSFRFFEVLAESAPGVVTTDDLIDRVWRGAVVSPETVTQRVKLLRQSLGDHAADPEIIGVVRGEGYRLLPPVKPATGLGRDSAKARAYVGGLAAALVVAIVAAFLFVMTRDPVNDGELAPISIAVLAFDDMSAGGDNEFLAEGFAEELLNRLSRVAGLRVIARTTAFSFKGKHLTVAEIADQLGVDAIVHGSIRIDEDKLRVSVQLIDASTEENTWAQTYDRKLADILSIQEEVSSSVVNELRVTLLDESGMDIDPIAYSLYLRSRQLNHTNSPRRALEAIPLLERALEIEPEFVNAIGELARANLLSYYGAGENESTAEGHLAAAFELVGRAELVAPDDPYVIALRGWAEFHHEGNIDEGIELFERALQLDPDHDDAIRLAAISYPMRGYNERAIELWRRLLPRDPLCVVCQFSWVAAHVGLDRLEEAEDSLKTLVAISEGVRLAESQNWMGALHLLKGRAAAALELFESGDVVEPHRSLGRALALHDLGRTEEFRQLFAELNDEWSQPDSGWLEGITTIHGWTGDLDQAFDWLMRDLESHDHRAVLFGGMWGPYFRRMRADPRWQQAQSRLVELRAEAATNH